jgi:hypothetical protein
MSNDYSVPAKPHILPVAGLALRMWLESHGIQDGKPVFVQFDFQVDSPGATYQGIFLPKEGENV